ncbi:histone deacetylase 11 [Plakobranchus ocellatus]|uniref:Histone deacetylase 11 n=1 Tax=Plakobranchus ocellatus TaxID=259542 RepID=A0AAV4DM72_9GAST|nr:histone deacetylase 11 [Plakobranchus ocellatus]
MPAGTSWPRYIAAVSAMMLSMFAGAQTVHVFYNPLQDFESRIESEKQKLLIAKQKDSSAAVAPSTATSTTPSSTLPSS